MEKKSFFEGGFGKYLLPGILLQSVLIGGGYATGRETVTYGAKFGANGWIAGVAAMIFFGLMAVLTFEMARVFKVYDYKSMIQKLIGPLWPLFDVAYVLMMIFFIAVMASASGSIVEDLLGVNYWVGVCILITITGGLIFFGDSIIEKFETWGTLLLYGGYITFTVLVIAARGSNIGTVMATADNSYTDPAGIPWIIWTGIIYVAYNLAIYPAAMFSLKRQTSRKETVISGLIAGAVMILPWFMTYFALMSFYPDERVLSANIPWLVMMQNIGAPGFLSGIFGIVMGWTLIETSTGVIHALLGRINVELKERGKHTLSRKKQAIVTIGVLILACVLSKIGIIDLIDKGYTALSYVFMALYLFPILTIGVYKILKKEPIKVNTAMVNKDKDSKLAVNEI